MTQASSLITDAKGYAREMATAAAGYLEDAVDAVEWASWDSSVGAPQVSLPAFPSFTEITPPEFSDVQMNLPPEPGDSPVFQDIPAINVLASPTAPGAAPKLVLPTKPSQARAFSEAPPTIEFKGNFPTPAAIVAIEAPVFAERKEPNPEFFAPGRFEGIEPDAPTDAPTDLAGIIGDQHRSASVSFVTMANGYVDSMMTKNYPEFRPQMTRLEAQISKYLEGGTALKPEVEKVIYARSQARNDLEASRVQGAALLDAAERGFTMPNGTVVSIMARARQEAANNNAKASNEIAIAQAEMEQKNLQFAVTTSVGLRTTMINASMTYLQLVGQLNGQALDYAKSVLGSVVEMYNVSVKVFTARLDAYKAKAAVYETQVRAGLASVEIYKAQIAALQALTQVDMSKVSMYKAQIEAQTASVNMYKTQVDAAVSQASMEKLKIELFQAQVQSFGAEVQAKNAEWQGYTAAISGEEAKARMFASEVQSYSAQVQGFSADIQAKSEVIRAMAATNDARSRQYAAEISAYEARVSAESKVSTTKLENQRQQVTAYTAETQSQIAKAQIGAEYYKAAAQVAVENGKFALQSVIATAEGKRNGTQLIATLQTANATVHANLAGAAMAGMNALAVEYAEDA